MTSLPYSQNVVRKDGKGDTQNQVAPETGLEQSLGFSRTKENEKIQTIVTYLTFTMVIYFNI